jgi:predicted GIY-YIG superfamily endonuclease
MYCIYVLRSLRNNKRYTGVTNKDPTDRLKEHNSGKNSFTKNNKPFVLLYTEKFLSLEQAKRREKFLKTGQGRRFLDRIIPP